MRRRLARQGPPRPPRHTRRKNAIGSMRMPCLHTVRGGAGHARCWRSIWRRGGTQRAGPGRRRHRPALLEPGKECRRPHQVAVKTDACPCMQAKPRVHLDPHTSPICLQTIVATHKGCKFMSLHHGAGAWPKEQRTPRLTCRPTSHDEHALPPGRRRHPGHHARPPTRPPRPQCRQGGGLQTK